MADLKEIGRELVELTVKEVKELADYLKDEYGIEPAAAVQLLLDLLLTVEKLLKNKQNLMLFLHQAVLLNCSCETC